MSAIDEAFIRAYQPDASPLHPYLAEGQRAIAPQPTLDPPQPTDAASLDDAATPTPYFQVTSDQASAFESLTSTPPETQDDAPAEVPIASPPPHAERRPLSAFAEPAAPVEAVFKPGLEVDRFRWPTVCDDLTTHWASHFSDAINALVNAGESGRSMIGIAATNEGAGATTLSLCLAKLLTKAGKSIALVDGNFTDPQLANRLGLAVDSGWEHVLSGDTPLAESVVYSIGDSLALLPLIAGGLRASERLDSIHASVTAGVLRYHYDMVLVDLGSISGRGQTPVARTIASQFRIDAALLATDRADGQTLRQITAAAPEIAAVLLGAVENQTTLAAAAG